MVWVWCGPQARSAFLCIKWCHLLTKRPIFSWARAEPALARQDYLGGGALKKVKKRVTFCTVSTFQAFCSKSALRATWNQHHPFCSKGGLCPSLPGGWPFLGLANVNVVCTNSSVFNVAGVLDQRKLAYIFCRKLHVAPYNSPFFSLRGPRAGAPPRCTPEAEHKLTFPDMIRK